MHADEPVSDDVDTRRQVSIDEAEEQHVGGGGGEEGPTQVTHSLFPAPPSVYARFTRDNVARFRVLQAAKEQDEHDDTFDWTNADPTERLRRQVEILTRASEERAKDDVRMQRAEEDKEEKRGPAALLPAPDWDVLLSMEPVRVDWIEGEGHYTCFGEQWPVDEALPPLDAMGMTQIYPHDASVGRADVLTTLLRTMLKSYLGLIDVILAPPVEYLANEYDQTTGQVVSQQWRFTSQDKAREINDLSINFMHLLNESRPLQAREQLRDMMRQQLARRKEEAVLIQSQCQSIRQEIQKIRERMTSETLESIDGV